MVNSTAIPLSDLKCLLAPRPRDAHKGLFGHVLIVGGNEGMAGAARLAAEAALRIGAGLVSVATKKDHIEAILSGRPEIMAQGVKGARDLNSLLGKATVIVVGTGLGQTSWSQQLFKRTLATGLPKVVDADALNLLAKHHQKSQQWILTPHPGEAARLLNCTIKDVQADRIKAVTALQAQYGGVIVLKGAGSLICSANSLTICDLGNPGMTSAGMGDVLSGVIGGLLSQHLTLQQAAECGVYLHACAGDLVAAQQGERGLLASDLMPYLRNLVNS
ncbi:MAG: Bifunctional NAD(P)H-hydrate repair enzyme Nnr [Pseudomonadota bacterium]|jgi:NAD(P)H-hydrate epimerase